MLGMPEKKTKFTVIRVCLGRGLVVRFSELDGIDHSF